MLYLQSQTTPPPKSRMQNGAFFSSRGLIIDLFFFWGGGGRGVSDPCFSVRDCSIFRIRVNLVRSSWTTALGYWLPHGSHEVPCKARVSTVYGPLNLAPEIRNQKTFPYCKCEEQMERFPLSIYTDKGKIQKMCFDDFIHVKLSFTLLIYMNSEL